MECLRLRVKDIDFVYGQILIRDAKGDKDRVTVLPSIVIHTLQKPGTINRERQTANYEPRTTKTSRSSPSSRAEGVMMVLPLMRIFSRPAIARLTSSSQTKS
jgi:integrase